MCQRARGELSSCVSYCEVTKGCNNIMAIQLENETDIIYYGKARSSEAICLVTVLWHESTMYHCSYYMLGDCPLTQIYHVPLQLRYAWWLFSDTNLLCIITVTICLVTVLWHESTTYHCSYYMPGDCPLTRIYYLPLQLLYAWWLSSDTFLPCTIVVTICLVTILWHESTLYHCSYYRVRIHFNRGCYRPSIAL